MFNFLKKDPKEAGIALMQGDRFLSQGDFKRAIEFHTRAIQLLPKNAEVLENAYWSRGLAQMNLNNLTQAISDFSEAIKLNKEYLVAYSLRGQCYSKLQDWPKAIADFEKALTLQFDVWHQVAAEKLEHSGIVHHKQVKYEIHIEAALAYNQIIDFKNCLKHLEAAYEIKPHDQTLDYIQQVRHRIALKNR